MSIGGAMSSAVTALLSQSQALAIISNNLANADTYGYKSVSADFKTLVTDSATSGATGTGGVSVSAQQNVTTQGELTSTGVSTNVAISGNGLLPVTYNKDTSEVYYTRDGNFTTDSQGYLAENGYYLMGYPTTTDGTISGAMQAININSLSSTASATSTASLEANLPADATVGFSSTTTMEIYDSLGGAEDLSTTWTKTAANTWTLTINNPVSTTDTSVATGTVGGTTSYTVSFNSDGSLGTITDSSGATVDAATITVSSWTDGAAASTISLDLGTSNSVSGLTQYSSGTTGSSIPTIDISSTEQNGVAYGSLKSIAIASNGLVQATYTNGQTLDIYQIKIATFANVDGLSPVTGNVYAATPDSGSATLKVPGTGGAGTLEGGELETSTVDTTTEFSKMIVAQQAYSAASQVISTSNNMFSALQQAARS